MEWQILVCVVLLLVEAARGTEVPMQDMCKIDACSDIIMNYDIQDCQPRHQLDNCIRDKVLRDGMCIGHKREATEVWLKQHELQQKAHCGAVDVRNGCPFSVCNARQQVVEIQSPRECRDGREFIKCLRNRVLTQPNCRGEQKRLTEKGIRGLQATEEAKCTAKAVVEGCLYADVCEKMVEIESHSECEQGMKFIDCIQGKVLRLANYKNCKGAEREYTEEGLKSLKAMYFDHCNPDSATSVVVSIVTVLVSVVAALVLTH